MNQALLLLLLAGPFVQAPFFALAPRSLQRYLGLFAALLSACYLAIVLYFSIGLGVEDDVTLKYAWLPRAMVWFSLRADGLGLFFALLITGMGTLVCVYAQGYMDSSRARIRKFYCYLSIFMGSMLGAVLADNLLLLFMFWEMTSVISYLLIGYENEKPEARSASRLGFLTTAASGLCLLIGVVMIGVLDSTLELSEVAEHGLILQQHPLWVFVIMALVLTAVAGKSAQFPLHYWLPQAMAAPTPVSAYLHSATMVKLGIYLVARMYVLFVDSALWLPLVAVLSLITVLLGGFLALFAYRLKQILAYATVSQLGFFISFYGLGDSEGLAYDYVHIFNHALYKASLFMLVGILGHATKVYDIRHLVGLPRKMPLFAVVFGISLAAMAGIPGTTGFLSKELLVNDLIYASKDMQAGLWLIGGLLLGLMLKVAFSLRLFYYVFLCRQGEELVVHKAPGWKLYLSPFILSTLALVWGVWPQGLEALSRNYFIQGLHVADAKEIVLWHGWGLNLAVSVALFAGGFLIFRFSRRYERTGTEQVSGMAHSVSQFFDRIPDYARSLTSCVHGTRVHQHLAWIIGAAALLLGSFYLQYQPQLHWPDSFSYREIVQLLMTISVWLLVVIRSAWERLLVLSLVGFLTVAYFVLYRAPDPALTQLVVEVATLSVLILFVFSLPESKPQAVSWLRIGLAAIGGVLMGLIPCFNGASLGTYDLAQFFVTHSPTLAKGTNTVNTILVDFRAIDTLGEIAVVVAAALGIAALRPSPTAAVSEPPKPRIPSAIVPAVLPVVLYLAVPVAIYLLLRGHNYPGGGFAAGVVLASSLILWRIGTGSRKDPLESYISPHKLMLVGLGMSVAAASISLFVEGRLLVAYFGAGSTLLSVPFLFDLGIFLLVLGAVDSIIVTMRTRTLEEAP